ncbi:MAG: hypothetical protein WCF19_04210 [Chlamydiales bacterium]
MGYIGLDFLDDEELRARFVEGIAQLPLVAPKIDAPVPRRISSLSSISASEKTAPAPRYAPALSPPPRSVMIDLINLHMKTEKLAGEEADLLHLRLQKHTADNERLAKEREAALEQEAIAAQSRDTWSALVTAGRYIAGASMIAIGAATGGVPGALLIAAGVVGTAAQVAQDVNAVSWYTKSIEDQQRISRDIQTFATLLQLGLGLASAVGAWQAGVWAAAQINGASVATTAESVIGGAASVASVTGKVGTSYYEKQIAYLQAQTREWDTQMTLNNQASFHASADMSKVIQETQQQVEGLRKSIEAMMVEIS